MRRPRLCSATTDRGPPFLFQALGFKYYGPIDGHDLDELVNVLQNLKKVKGPHHVDHHDLWIDPKNPRRMIDSNDGGVDVTTNGGATWHAPPLPIAQFYHVSADNSFPYRLYSGQQESGSVGIKSRGDEGEITFRDWRPVAAEEYGYVVADPLDPDIIIGGKLTRFDRRTGQAQDILPVPVQTEDFRMLRTEPVVFSPLDPHLLFFAGNTLWQTRDRLSRP